MSPEDYITATRIIERTAKKYARRLRRRDAVRDLVNTAWAVLLEPKTLGRFSPEKGSWEGYVLVIAARSMRQELWASAAPVSGSKCRASHWAAGLASTGTEALSTRSDAPLMASPPPSPDAWAIGQEFIDAVRSALQDQPGAELAMAVLLEGLTPAETADRHAVSSARVNTAVRAALTTTRATLGHFARGSASPEGIDHDHE